MNAPERRPQKSRTLLIKLEFPLAYTELTLDHFPKYGWVGTTLFPSFTREARAGLGGHKLGTQIGSAT